jgi:hypothetical protein
LIGKIAYDPELDHYFTTTSIEDVRKNVLDSLKFNSTGQNVTKDIIIDLIIIANELNNGVLTKFNAVKK